MKIPNGSLSPQDILPGANLSGANLEGADLSGANLEGADLSGADLSEARLFDAILSNADLFQANLSQAKASKADFYNANLFDADLSRASLKKANLSETDLSDTNLSGTRLIDADLSGSELNNANLSEADFKNANLTGADLVDIESTGTIFQQTIFADADLRNVDLSHINLQGADLSRSDIRGTDFTKANLNRETKVGGICSKPSSGREYDELAQSYHHLKSEFSDNGIDHRARSARFSEKHARTREALHRQQWSMWFGMSLSRFLTGYGTRVSQVLICTAILLGVTTLWYSIVPTSNTGWEGGSLYYSVTTFVTSPPHPPRASGSIIATLTDVIVLIETYLGTTFIILLGYVLSNRDRI